MSVKASGKYVEKQTHNFYRLIDTYSFHNGIYMTTHSILTRVLRPRYNLDLHL